MNKRITLLIHSLGGGGAEGVCVTLANGFVERGFTVTLVVLYLDDAARSARKNELDSRVELIVLNRRHARTAVISLYRHLKEQRPETILVFNHQLAILIVLLRMIMGSKFSIIARTINTLSMSQQNQKSVWHRYAVNFFIRKYYPKADKIITQSNGMKENLISCYHIPKEKLITINNPLNQKIERYIQNNELGSQNGTYLLCVGRLVKQKALQYAIRGFAGIAEACPDLRLKLIGQGPLEGGLKKLACAMGIGHRVDFEGFQQNTIPYYRNAKLTLLTSLYEGFPNVLVESISLGTPVVAFDCPSGPREIIDDGINGYLARYQDTEHLVECLKKALNRTWDTVTVSASAEKYRLAHIIKQYISVIAE